MLDTPSLIPLSDPAPRCWALIPCAGTGSRAGAAGPKQYQLLAGQPMVLHTLAAFAAVPRITRTLVVVAPEDTFFATQAVDDAHVLVASCGGSTRAASVLNGLNVLLGQGAARHDWVLVHDAARCLIRPDQIDQLIDACWQDDVGGLLALPLPDTLKRESLGRVAATLERADKWLAQTPQMFRMGSLLDALQVAGTTVTDESSAMEAMGLSPKLVPGSAQNFKVTYPQDFCLAEAVLMTRSSGDCALLQQSASEFKRASDMNFRIGEGWDIHALVAGRKLMLGGVEIPYHLGLLGHSDADVLLHAITDALLGAAALGDIGTHFPDTDARFKGADSLVLLTEAARRVRAQGFEIGNVDSTVIAQAPKLMPYMAAMRAQIALALALEVDQVNVKAKTAEKMGPVGLGQAMEARATVLLQKFT